MGCGNSSTSGPRESSVYIFKKGTKAGPRHHAEYLSIPKDNQKMKHEILEKKEKKEKKKEKK